MTREAPLQGAAGARGHAALQRAVEELVCRAGRHFPPDVVRALERAAASEEDDTARGVLQTIVERVQAARPRGRALASDTGLVTFFVRVGCAFPELDALDGAFVDAVVAATRHEPLAAHTVDVLTGESQPGNVGRGVPVVHYEFVPDQADCRITVLLKGAASEAVSALWVLQPGESGVELERIGDRLASLIAGAGGRPCPPLVVGVGLGGTPERAMYLSRRALLRPVGESSSEAALAALESSWRECVNDGGAGPMGLGGGPTALAVHVEAADRHAGFLAVGVSVACWSDRRASVFIDRSGAVHW